MAEVVTALYFNRAEDASTVVGSRGLGGAGRLDADIALIAQDDEHGFGLGYAQPASIGALLARGVIGLAPLEAEGGPWEAMGGLADRLIGKGVSREMLVEIAGAALQHSAVVLLVADENVALGTFPSADRTRSWRLGPHVAQGILPLLAFESPLGNPTIPDVDIYVCPYGDYPFTRQGAGVPIPECPTHKVPLRRQ